MRDARVIRVLGELLLQHRRRLQVGGIGLVGLRLRAGDVQRREDLRLVVVRVLGGQRLEGLRARGLAGALGRLAKSA